MVFRRDVALGLRPRLSGCSQPISTVPSSWIAIGSPIWTVSRNSSPSMSTVTMRWSFQTSAMSTPAAANVSIGFENSRASGPTPIACVTNDSLTSASGS